MNENANEVEELALSVDQAKRMIERGEAIRRLCKDEDFKSIVIEGYFKDEATRLVHMASLENVASNPEALNGVMKDIHAVGTFKQYLDYSVTLSNHARYEMENMEAELEEARNEESGA